MAPFYSSNNCIKFGTYSYDNSAVLENKPANTIIPYTTGIIKWYLTELSLDDKWRFGLLTYPEYLEWLKQLQEKESKKTGSNTFWKDDTGERTNLSEADYQEFLSANNIDVSNNSTVDIDKLINMPEASDNSIKFETPASAPVAAASDEPDIEAILASVNRDIHGGESILSQEEINAMFAAANA